MTVTWQRSVTEVTWQSATAPGVTWSTIVNQGTTGGVTVHNSLTGRSAANAHPISAITGLQAALDDLSGGGGGGAVASVNGETGDVVLSADDVGALAEDAGAGGFLSGNFPNPGVNTEALQDAVGGMVGAGLAYDDGAGTLAVSFGTTAGTAAQGNDSRLSDARTPTAHAASHASAGSDPLTLSQSQITGLAAALAALQPLDADLTAVAALSTTTFGRALLELADAAALRTAAGLVIGTDVAAESTRAEVLFSQDEGPSLSLSTSDQSLIDSGTAPTITAAAGDLIEIDAGINTVQNSGSTQTLTFKLKVGSTTVCAAAQSWSNSSATGQHVLRAAIRVEAASDLNASLFTWNRQFVPISANGVATENIGSGVTVDLTVVSGAATATQTSQLQWIAIKRTRP